MSDANFNPSAIQSLEKELEENPYNIRALSELAQWFANQGDYTSACQHYEKIVRTDEDNVKAWTALGHCYLLKGEYQKCSTAYQRALQSSTDNKDPQLWYGVGLLYNKFDNYDQAEPAYQMVLKIEPEFEQKHEILYKLGLIYKKTDNFDTAIEYLRSCLACTNIPLVRKIDVLCHVGNCFEKQANLPEAIENYKQALLLEEENFKTMEYLGWAHYLSSQYDEAISMFNRALNYVKDNCAEAGDLHYLIGMCHFAQAAYADGQVAMQRAIYKNPNAYIYWCSIGILYALAVQAQDAFDCFVKASNINPECGLVWFNMGVLYEVCKQKQEAVLAYQRSYTLESTMTQSLARKEQLQVNQDLDQLPQFIHPTFEISDIPFSIKKADKAAKPTSSLPDIHKFNRTSPELPPPKPAKQNSDPESVVESSHSDEAEPSKEPKRSGSAFVSQPKATFPKKLPTSSALPSAVPVSSVMPAVQMPSVAPTTPVAPVIPVAPVASSAAHPFMSMPGMPTQDPARMMEMPFMFNPSDPKQAMMNPYQMVMNPMMYPWMFMNPMAGMMQMPQGPPSAEAEPTEVKAKRTHEGNDPSAKKKRK